MHPTRTATGIRLRRRSPRPPRSFDRLEDRVLLALDLSTAVPLRLPSNSVPVSVAAGQPLLYQIQVPPDRTGDRLVAALSATTAPLRLALLDRQGNLLIQSDGQSAGNPGPQLVQYLGAGTTFYLEVECRAGVAATTLTEALIPATNPLTATPPDPSWTVTGLAPIVTGDFNGDGQPDVVTPSGVRLGLGDGAFSAGVSPLPTGILPFQIVAGDFTPGGRADLAVLDANTRRLDILLGNGDGTFRVGQTFGVGLNPSALVAGAFTPGGPTDLAVVDAATGLLTILLGNGEGSFRVGQTLGVSDHPSALVAGDFSGDGRTDLAAADATTGTLTLLLNTGDGTFQTGSTLDVGADPSALVAGDFSGDGRTDLAVLGQDANGATLHVLLAQGGGAFAPAVAVVLPSQTAPLALIAGDFNGDGRADLAVATEDDASELGDVTVLLSQGGGAFSAGPTSRFPDPSLGLATDHFHSGSRADLAVLDGATGSVTVLAGNGDGTFQGGNTSQVGSDPLPIASGHFTTGPNVDLAVGNFASATVSILLGNGDGTFRLGTTIPLPDGESPYSIVTGSFFGDGATDLAVLSWASDYVSPGTVTIFRGNGDGTFLQGNTYPVGVDPDQLIAARFVPNGPLDLAVVDSSSSPTDLQLLMGRGDGTFSEPAPYVLGSYLTAVAAGDFHGAAGTELAVADYLADSVTILSVDSAGQITPDYSVSLPSGSGPYSLAAGNFGPGGGTGLAVADNASSDLTILQPGADGQLAPMFVVPLGPTTYPLDVVTGHFTGGSATDLAVSLSGTNQVAILQGDGQGHFQTWATIATESLPQQIAAADFNGDGRDDLALPLPGENTVAVRLDLGNGDFAAPGSQLSTVADSPVVADLGAGAPDMFTIDQAGNTLWRRGRPTQPGSFSFAPPITINPGFPSRGIAFVPGRLPTTGPISPSAAAIPLIASIDETDNSVSLYAYEGGRFQRVGSVATGSFPVQVVAGDLNGDGLPDLVIRNAGDGTLTLALGDGRGGFATSADPLRTGPDNSGVALAYLNGPGLPDLIVTDQVSGAICVFRNQEGRTFAPPSIYPAGLGPYTEPAEGSTVPVVAREGTVGVAVGRFTAGGSPGLVTANPGSNSFGVLDGLGGGALANPRAVGTTTPARTIVTADFNGDGVSDVAVLGGDVVSVFLGDGRGGFVPASSASVGPNATGLTAADLGSGKPDLLVGNTFGDLLILYGDGRGVFHPSSLIDQRSRVAAYSLGAGQPVQFVVANPGVGTVTAQLGPVQQALGGQQGVLVPGAVTLADLNGDGLPDAIVVNSAENEVLVYLGRGEGLFAPPQSFRVGDDPVSVTVANLDSDGQPDLVVANQGSNNVSILLGTSPNQPWSLVSGPRVQTGTGPTSTAVTDFFGLGRLDLVVTDSGSNDVRILPGLGGGFFDDAHPILIPTGADPTRVVALSAGPDAPRGLMVLDTGSDQLTWLSAGEGGTVVTSILSSGGESPVAAVATTSASGADAVLVGNAGDGRLSVFQVGARGLQLDRTAVAGNASSWIDITTDHQGHFFEMDADGQISPIQVALTLGGGSSPAGTSSTGPPILAETGLVEQQVTSGGPIEGGTLTPVPSIQSELVEEAGASLAGPEESAAVIQGIVSPGAVPPNQFAPRAAAPGSIPEQEWQAGDEPEDSSSPSKATTAVVSLVAGLEESFAAARHAGNALWGPGVAPLRGVSFRVPRRLTAQAVRWSPVAVATGFPGAGLAARLAGAALNAAQPSDETLPPPEMGPSRPAAVPGHRTEPGDGAAPVEVSVRRGTALAPVLVGLAALVRALGDRAVRSGTRLGATGSVFRTRAAGRGNTG